MGGATAGRAKRLGGPGPEHLWHWPANRPGVPLLPLLAVASVLGAAVGAVASLVVAGLVVYYLVTTNPRAFLKLRTLLPGQDEE